ncbi:MAG: hypothetical protein NZL95_05515 [Chitinophagales bacterium]|nr:hypothetical protein [Chitinophagales bacterium]MDW8427992.1 hypothetical protein [Chitinophagales bacterium]
MEKVVNYGSLFIARNVLAVAFIIIGLRTFCQTVSNHVEYTKPAGWTEKMVGTDKYFFPPNAEDSKVLAVAIISPFKTQARDRKKDFEQYLRGRIRTDEQLKYFSKVAELHSTCSSEPMLAAVMDVQTTKGLARRMYLAFPGSEKWGVLAVVTGNESVMKKYQADLNAFVASCLKADVWTTYQMIRTEETAAATKPTTEASPAPSAREPAASGKSRIRAMYVANILQMVPNTYTYGYTYKNFNTFWTILDNGKVYFGYPPENPHEFDFHAACSKQGDCVSYEEKSGQLQFTWKNQSVALSLDAAQITLGAVYSGQSGPTVFRKIASENGTRLQGAYRRKAFVNLNSAAASGNVSAETIFVFSKDGRFSVYGWSGFVATSKGSPMSSTQAPGAIAPPPPPAGVGVAASNQDMRYGLYEVKNNQLILTYADGKKEQYFFFRYPQEEEDVLAIGGVNYISVED